VRGEVTSKAFVAAHHNIFRQAEAAAHVINLIEGFN
jgi:hypothetical protein